MRPVSCAGLHHQLAAGQWSGVGDIPLAGVSATKHACSTCLAPVCAEVSLDALVGASHALIPLARSPRVSPRKTTGRTVFPDSSPNTLGDPPAGVAPEYRRRRSTAVPSDTSFVACLAYHPPLPSDLSAYSTARRCPLGCLPLPGTAHLPARFALDEAGRPPSRERLKAARGPLVEGRTPDACVIPLYSTGCS